MSDTKPKSLWGEIKLDKPVFLPKIALQEQAEALTEATNKILKGQITESVRKDNGDLFAKNEDLLVFDFQIFAPSLGKGYTYTLFTITHRLAQTFPIAFRLPTNFSEDEENILHTAVLDENWEISSDWLIIFNQKNFTRTLEFILQAESTLEVVHTLLHQSMPVSKAA